MSDKPLPWLWPPNWFCNSPLAWLLVQPPFLCTKSTNTTYSTSNLTKMFSYTLCLQDYRFPLSLFFSFSLCFLYLFDLILCWTYGNCTSSQTQMFWVCFRSPFWLALYPALSWPSPSSQLIYCCVAPFARGSSSPGSEPLFNFFHISGTATQPQPPSLNPSSRSICFQTSCHPSPNSSHHHQARLLPQNSLEMTGLISTGWP